MQVPLLPLQIPMMTPYAVGLVNGWLFLGDEPALIDVGPNTVQAWQDLLAGLAAHGVSPADLRHILITHAHVDHYGNGQRLAQAAPRAAIYAPDIAHARPMLLDSEEEWQRQGEFMVRALLVSGLPDSMAQKGFDYFAAMRQVGSAVPVTQWLYGGERLTFGNGVWEVVRLPGHSTTQIGLWERECNWFISADHLLPRISSNALLEPPAPGETRRPRALPQYVDALKWMAALPPQQIFPGHGNPFFDQHALIAKRLEGIEQRADQLYRAIQVQPRTVYELVTLLFPQLNESQLFLAVSEIAGHLDILEARNLAAYEGRAVRFYHAVEPSALSTGGDGMTILEEPFYHTLLAAPGRAYDVIVTTDGETQAVAEVCETLGMTVHRHFRIIPGLSATGRGNAVLDLAKHPHVKRIEPDGDVQAL